MRPLRGIFGRSHGEGSPSAKHRRMSAITPSPAPSSGLPRFAGARSRAGCDTVPLPAPSASRIEEIEFRSHTQVLLRLRQSTALRCACKLPVTRSHALFNALKTYVACGDIQHYFLVRRCPHIEVHRFRTWVTRTRSCYPQTSESGSGCCLSPVLIPIQ
jgi:hypothetical protein